MMMRTTILCALVVVAAALPTQLLSADDEWHTYKELHSKTYRTPEHEAAAMRAWAQNDLIIHEHNAKNLSWTLGHNEYSDMSWEDFKQVMLPGLFLNRNPTNAQRMMVTVPGAPAVADSVDWTTKGAVTPVKNQKQCGSCWSFSTTGSVEGALVAVTGEDLISLSEEDLVQCDKVDDGCQGGLMDNAFEWIEKNGICAEADYPYTSGGGSTGTCKKSCTPVVTLTSYKDVPSKDEDALKSAVSMQPVSIALEADKSAFQLYKSGVLDSASCGKKLDHGVLIVGYGNDETTGKDFWKVKNSWGPTWGDAGYLKIVRGKDMCGLAQQPSYPKGVKKASGPSPGPPTPTPTPPSPSGTTHYGDPSAGCLSDEVDVMIQGVAGDFCTPKCSLFKHCPTDVPAGVTATPECALSDASSGSKYCALICSPTNYAGECGAATCKSISGTGICTYDD